MRSFYLYLERPIHNTIKEAFKGFDIHTISKEVINKNNLTNKNIILVLNENLLTNLSNLFFLNNNVVIIFLDKNKLDRNKYSKIKIFVGHTNINKFKDDVTTFFESKPFIFDDIRIQGEKIINPKVEKWVFLTPLEKEILILLLENEKIQKNFLLENILKLRKDTETKTIESHLSRIRKKLLSINSKIEIISKDNMVLLVT